MLMAIVITITEALAELKTIGKRVEKKRESILQFLARQDGIKDPLEKQGGSMTYIRAERQAVSDLNQRHVQIRSKIQQKNHEVEITVEGITKTVAAWLTWRKEIAPGVQQFLARMRSGIVQSRDAAQKKGFGIVPVGGTAQQPSDLVINVDEADLAKETELIEAVLGGLDGQLSLKNATTTIELE
jgi:hypothetical protein